MAQSAVPPASPWKRYRLIALLVLVVLAVGAYLAWPRVQETLWLGRLHSDDARVRKAAQEDLAASDHAGLDERLLDVLGDPEHSFFVRTQVGGILMRRGQLTGVEKVLRSDNLDARTAALSSLLAKEPTLGRAWFRREYLERPEYRIEETVLAWLARDGDDSRTAAVDAALRLQLDEVLPAFRRIVATAKDATLTPGQQQVLVAAARGLFQLGDCEVLADLVEPARKATTDIIRLRLMQVIYESVLGAGARCPDAVSPDVVKEIVLGGFEGGLNARHGALLILAQQPSWAGELSDKLLSILDGESGDTEYVRRAALAALAAGNVSGLSERLARYFHDASPSVRSEAVTTSTVVPGSWASCWIGVLRNETENEVAYDAALSLLREQAGSYVGMPEKLNVRKTSDVTAFRHGMFARGESHGMSRDAWADAWFGWAAEQAGLDAPRTLQALATRKAFWGAADEGDVSAAQAALEGALGREAGLWTYEQGWLDAR